MKVCLVSNYLPEYHSIWGGAERAAFLLIEGLKKKNIDISVITNHTEIDAPNRDIFFIKKDNHISTKIINRLFNFSYYNPLLKEKFSKIIDSINPDLIHLQNFSSFSVSIIKEVKTKKIPLVLSVYDYWAFCPNGLLLYRFKEQCNYFQGLRCRDCFRFVPYGRCSYFNTLERIYFKKYLNFIDRFIVLSNDSFRILLKYGIEEKRIEIIPLPLYESIDIAPTYQEGLILFVGWISYNKGLHILLEAISYIIEQFPFISLWVVETGTIASYKRYISDLINKLSLNSKIKFLGKLSYQQLKEILEMAHIVVVPEQWHNPLPLILCEAINFKKPIVASRIGGIPEIVNQERFLAQYNDPKDFSRRISWILRNNDMALEYAKALNQKVSAVLDVHKNLDNIIQLYHKVIKD
ncbi:MAG: glycosyltransferase [Candidatus Omnitrophica bacterium]|nr:glycosyltransferase [Candidatus Omnitrophota bacterium]